MRKMTTVAVTLLLWASVFACGRQLSVEYPPIDELLIDLSVFPDEWEATQPDFEHPPHAPWSGPGHLVEIVRQNFYSSSDLYTGVIVEIRRYDSGQSATREYERRLEVVFREDSYTWTTLPAVVHESTIADHARYACSEVGCAYFARYGVYTYHSGVRIHDTDTITYTDLLPVLLQAIDGRMALALDNEVE